MVLFSHSSYASNLGGKQTDKGKQMELKKDLYEKDGEYVLSDGHPKKWAGLGCHKVASKGATLSTEQVKAYGLKKETKAKAPKENKAK